MKAARGCANVFQSEHGEESLVAAVAGICRRVATTAVQTARHLHSRGVWRIRPRDPRGGADDAHHRRIRRGMNGASSIHTNIFRLTLRRNVLVDEQKRRAHVETREVEKMSRKRWFESSDGTVSARRTGIRMHSSRHEPGTHSGCRRGVGRKAAGYAGKGSAVWAAANWPSIYPAKAGCKACETGYCEGVSRRVLSAVGSSRIAPISPQLILCYIVERVTRSA
jgi:hypothetical protein